MTESTENESIAHLQHQLRTPVNHVLGYSEILIDEATRRNLLGLVPAFEQIRVGGHQLLGSIQKAFNDEGGTASAPALDALMSDLGNKASEVLHHSEVLREEIVESHQQMLDDVDTISGALRNLLKYSKQHHFLPPVPSDAIVPFTEPASRQIQDSHNRAAGTIVLADDDDANRNVLRRHLEAEGHQPIDARNGKEVLSILETHPCDLVLLDIMMPELDGFETLRNMKEDVRLRDIPVIMISALDQLSSVVQCIELGAEDHLSKPFNRVLLRSRIGASLEKKRLRDRERRQTEELKETLLLLEKAKEQLALQATQDVVTGLANRRSVDAYIDFCVEQEKPFNVFYIDLNEFKKINDTYGHQAGDDLLKQVGSRLRLAFRSSDIVGRWGGDEFVGVIVGCFSNTEEDVARIAGCFKDEFVIDTGNTLIRAKVGAAIGNAVWKPGSDVSEVLKRADAAMYSTKQEQKNTG